MRGSSDGLAVIRATKGSCLTEDNQYDGYQDNQHHNANDDFHLQVLPPVLAGNCSSCLFKCACLKHERLCSALHPGGMPA